jgi:hypothetical protein
MNGDALMCRRARWWTLLGCAVLSVGCLQAGADPTGSGLYQINPGSADAGDASVDGSNACTDAGCPEGATPAAPTCDPSQCNAPADSQAYCTDEGKCSFKCNENFTESDGRCECAKGLHACNGGCFHCCSNSDCGNHVVCTNGTCSGCEANWGDCNSGSDGCETDLTKDDNCGSCGDHCCSDFCGCGFLWTGGKQCKKSGDSYACGC